MQLQAKSGLWIYVDVDYLASQANFTMIFQNYRSVSLKDTCHITVNLHFSKQAVGPTP